MWKRIAMLVAIAAAGAWLYQQGLIDLLREPEAAGAVLARLGIWAPILYVLAFAALEPFFVPGVAFMVPGALFFPFPQLFLLSWLGSLGAGIVGFGFARFLARDFVERRLPRWMRGYDERLATKGLQTVVVVRLTLFLMPPAHWLLGLSQVRFPAFVAGTALGFLPGIGVMAYLIAVVGESFGDWIAAQPPAFFVAVVLVWVLLLELRRRIARRRREAGAA